ncbi:stage II sporulation protein D [Caproiciproducens galactitolivorans]|nr:stage II sporulation protein D [Caproiciproducens galactitolivorans]QEY34709.1 stage II sporulation protein D [Caproiciproducens galactitolivorans]
MKGKAFLGLLLFLIMFTVPFLSIGAKIPDKTDKLKKAASSVPLAKPQQQSVAPGTKSAVSGFKILDTKSNTVITADDRSFLYGAIVTEMSPDFHPEALKAQGVAAYTYYSRLREQQRSNPTASLKGADFAADTQGWQIYVTKEQMKQRWGANFDTYYNKLTKVVDAIYGKVLKSDGELADATYYAISSGNTETSEDIWGGKRKYLVAVASPGDVFASGYQTTATFSTAQFKAAVLKTAPKANLSGDPSTWVGNIQRTASGTIKNIQIGGVNIKGSDIRSAFALRSPNFSISYANGTFTFLVKGYGHGVGMSQVGANYMASQGASYQQILAWYYPTTTLTTLH